VTKDAYYKIGIFILTLCIITWMFLPNSWGAESKETRSRDNLAADSLTATGTDKQYDCSRYHSFTRPERGLR
jgi:hypothetical protein